MKAEDNFIKQQYALKVGEGGLRGGNCSEATRIFPFRWAGLASWRGWFLMRAASSHLGDSSHKLRGEAFDSTRFVLEPSWQPFPMGVGGAITTMLIYVNECITSYPSR